VKEVFFDIFNLRMVSAYILHSKETGENIPLELFYEMIAEGLISHARQDIQEWARSTSAGRLDEETIFRTIIW
jgi:hypothetical protein